MKNEWWVILLWGLASLIYLSIAIHIIVSVALDVFLAKFNKAVDLWIKATVNRDKVTYIK